MENKGVPRGVRAIGIFVLLSAILLFLNGLISVVFRAGFGENRYFLGFEVGYSLLSQIILGMGIVLITLAIFMFFIRRGLWKGKSWARTSLIIISGVYFVASLIRLIWYYALAPLIPLFNQSINEMRLTLFGKFLLNLDIILSIIISYLNPLGILFNFAYLFSILTSPLSLIVYGLILKYLLFNQEAKEFFKN